MKSQPVHGERALLVEGDETALLIGDLHIGLESALRHSGINLPSQTESMRRRVEGLLTTTGATRLVILGDLKHSIDHPTTQEVRELPEFFRSLGVPVDIVPGNHDGALPPMSDNVKVHSADGMSLEEVGVAHGHAWPAKSVAERKLLVTCHNHPAVLLRDELGGRHKEPAWIRGKLTKTARERYTDLKRGAEFLVMPAFNNLLGGVAFNAFGPEDLLGPLIKNSYVDVEAASVYTVDGIDLGPIRELRRFARE
ncbi:MAG: metallophosphoesterase [Euryarchaeota archaeon]|nr:metallophosphoesterase [Euryarchaeota archaeon]